MSRMLLYTFGILIVILFVVNGLVFNGENISFNFHKIFCFSSLNTVKNFETFVSLTTVIALLFAILQFTAKRHLQQTLGCNKLARMK
jgi:hypothetical protein